MDVEIEVEDIWYNEFYINRIFELTIKTRGEEKSFKIGNSKESWTVKLERGGESFYFSKLDSAVNFIHRELRGSDKIDKLPPNILEKIQNKNRELESKIQNMIWSSEFSEPVSAK